MTDRPEPEETELGQSFREWLNQRGITETGEKKIDETPPPASESPSAIETPLPPDIRAGTWTIPLGVAWLFGGYLVPHFADHAPGTVRRLIGIGLIAWVISITCEMSIAYRLRADYPPLGMWQWTTNRRLSRVFNRGHETASKAANNGGCLTVVAGLTLPALFAAFYIFSALLAIAIPLWVAIVTLVTVTHLAVTIARHYTKGRQ